ncbi:CheW protein [Desulfonatronospira thiodismutans ASO3-1]|uniref:CheW protein n=1 Tax=Desulfonatronospira thiodismutans ASO3-1 TaxID=555779 RepID=D6SSS4_9BACT|nr:chemotaxis protein CheW [Desulfonatronospira thiodismutans]EFI33740.1 CheW protein [Desulfonatronospira thiodismutans ASO3-1]
MDNAKAGLSNTYLTFYLDQDLFGLNIDSVREVLEYTSITKVPRTEDYMLGVINVRGHAVPVVDLRVKFGLGQGEKTVDTCIIIVELSIHEESSIMGALVDGVQEVLDIPPEQIEKAPRLGSKIDTQFIRGIGKLEDKFVIILDIQSVFSVEELSSITEKSDQVSAESVASGTG